MVLGRHLGSSYVLARDWLSEEDGDLFLSRVVWWIHLVLFLFRGPGGNWLLLFNCCCGALLDPGMANMWRRGGNIRYDSSDGRSLAVIVPCAGRGVRGRVLSLVSVMNCRSCCLSCRFVRFGL